MRVRVRLILNPRHHVAIFPVAHGGQSSSGPPSWQNHFPGPPVALLRRTVELHHGRGAFHVRTVGFLRRTGVFLRGVGAFLRPTVEFLRLAGEFLRGPVESLHATVERSFVLKFEVFRGFGPLPAAVKGGE